MAEALFEALAIASMVNLQWLCKNMYVLRADWSTFTTTDHQLWPVLCMSSALVTRIHIHAQFISGGKGAGTRMERVIESVLRTTWIKMTEEQLGTGCFTPGQHANYQLLVQGMAQHAQTIYLILVPYLFP